MCMYVLCISFFSFSFSWSCIFDVRFSWFSVVVDDVCICICRCVFVCVYVVLMLYSSNLRNILEQEIDDMCVVLVTSIASITLTAT